jgi:amidohydrolase
VLCGGRPGRTILLRADMDALPIQEENDVPYRSTRDGVIHACGHDGHVAMLLGAARVLAGRRDTLAGNVVFAFQPSEERIPGGALGMIEDGALSDPPVDAAFGIHLTQGAPVGTVACRAGAANAAADTFRAEIIGKGGHASRPQIAVDPILIASHVVTALHAIVSREVRPIDPAVITIGTLHAGTVPNVIPPSATLSGTVRTFDQELREKLARRIEETIRGIAQAMGGDARLDYEFGYPPLVNDPAMTALVAEVAKDVVGEANVMQSDPNMASDDVAYFLQRAPGCHFVVGTANEARGLVWGNHHPRFDIDEDALLVGVRMWVAVTERYLSERPGRLT